MEGRGSSSREEGRRQGGRARRKAEDARNGEEGRRSEGRGRRLAIPYLLRLPAPPAPLSLGTFCCGLSTSCA